MQRGSLDSDRWDRARSLFGAALERDATEREAWLLVEAGDDSAVLHEVRSLLKRVEEEGPEPEVEVEPEVEPVIEEARAGGKRPLPPGLPTSIASYTLLSVLGEGGMGWVFEARQQSPDRRVALKVVKAGLAGADMRRRFERESQLLGRLHHPAIAQVFEAGVTQIGTGIELPYFAMELVEDAQTITHYAWEQQLDLEQRLQLFADVADGIEHGHQRGVMHRDIKPGNVVVDDSGRPRIIDFGLSRAIDSDGTASMQTVTGQIMGTPQYMSPEQFSGNPESVTLLSDVYSLGVLLFQLISGELPYQVEGKSLVEMADTVRSTPPRRLSATSHGSRASLSSRVDLDTIIAKAMEKEPARRYPSAAALSADLRRFLRGEPIDARPVSTLYQLRLFVRRHKALVAGTLAVLVVSVVAAVVSMRYAYLAELRADQLQDKTYALQITAAAQALEQGDHAAAAESLAQLPPELDGWERRHLASRLELERSVGQVTDKAPAAPDGRDYTLAFVGDLASQPSGTRFATTTPRGFVRLWDSRTGELTAEFDAGTGIPFLNSRLSFSEDGALFSVASKTGEGEPMKAWIVTAESGEVIGHFSADTIPNTHAFSAAKLSPDGLRFAWITPTALELHERTGTSWNRIGRRDAVRITSLTAPDVVAVPPPIEELSPLAWLPDGSGLLVQEATPDRTLVLLAGNDLHELYRWDMTLARLASMSVSADGTLLALGFEEQPPMLLSLADTTAAPRALDIAAHSAQWVALDPSGSRLLTSGQKGVVTLHDLDSGLALGTLTRHGNDRVKAAFSEGGDTIVSGGHDGTVRTYDADFATEPHVLRGHSSYVYVARPVLSGGQLVTGGWDAWPHQPGGARAGSLRWWDFQSGEPVAVWKGTSHWVRDVQPLPDGERLAVSLSMDRVPNEDPEDFLMIVDLDTGRAVDRIEGAVGGDLEWSEATGLLAQNTLREASTGSTQLPLSTSTFDGRTLQPVGEFPHGGSLAAHPFDELLAVAVTSKIKVYRLGDHSVAWTENLAPAVDPSEGALRLAFDPLGRWLAVGRKDDKLSVHDAHSGGLVAQLGGFQGKVLGLAFSPDGSRCFAGDGRGLLHVIDTAGWTRITSLRGHEDYIYRIAVSPDGERVITASGDGTVRLWDSVPDPQLIVARREHRRLVAQLEPRVLALLDGQQLEPKAAARQLKADTSLSEREREVALQVLLRESVARDPDPLGERLVR